MGLRQPEKGERLRPTKGDENGLERSYDLQVGEWKRS